MENQKRSLIVDAREQQVERCFKNILSDQNRMKKLCKESRRDGCLNFKSSTFLPRKALNANSASRRFNDSEQ